MRTLRSLALAAALVLAGAAASCASSSPFSPRTGVPAREVLAYEPISPDRPKSRGTEPARESASRPAAPDPAVAYVGGDAIPRSSLHESLLRHFPAECLAAADALVEAENVRREAARLEAPPVEPARVAESTDRAIAGVAARLGGGEPALAARIGGLGKSRDSFRAEIEEAEERRLLLARLARFEELTSDLVTLAEAVFAEEDEAGRALADLEDGADFSRLAANRSLSPSARDGGRLPAAPVEDLDPAVRAAIAGLKPRETTGVVAVLSPSGPRFAIYRVLEARAAFAATSREEAWRAVIASLETRPAGDDEILRWTLRNHRRYGVRIDLHATGTAGVDTR